MPPILPTPETGGRIPRIIHQTATNANLAPVLLQNTEFLRTSNPDFSYKLYNNADCVAFIRGTYGPQMLSYYDRIDPIYGAARADLFRYLVIYHQGGVYLDIKSRITCPISSVLSGDESYIIAQWSNASGQPYEGFGLKPELCHIPGGEFQQWHVIAAPRHPFLHAVLLAVFGAIDTYRPWRGKTGKPGVMRLTGPIIYTLSIAPLLSLYPHKFVRRESELGLQYSVLPGDSHKTTLGAHYSTSRVSIVQPLPSWRLANTAYQLYGAARRKGNSPASPRTPAK